MTRKTRTLAERAQRALEVETRVTAAAKKKAERLEADAKAAQDAYDTHERRRAFLATDPDLPIEAEPVRRTRAPRPPADAAPAATS